MAFPNLGVIPRPMRCFRPWKCKIVLFCFVKYPDADANVCSCENPGLLDTLVLHVLVRGCYRIIWSVITRS